MRKFYVVAFFFSFWGVWEKPVEAVGQDQPKEAGVDTIEEGFSAFDRGDFAAAEAVFRQHFEPGAPNGHLLYNLGNALFRQGHIGEAAAAFLAARQLLPRDGDVRANLQYTLERSKDRLKPELPSTPGRSALFWLDVLTVKEMAWLAVGTFCVGLWLLTVAFWVPAVRIAGVVVAVVGVVLLVGLGLTLRSDQAWGAVVASEVPVRSGPGEQNSVLFRLHEGAPFVWRDQIGGWYKIELSDGKKGWVLNEQVRVYLKPQAS